MRWLVTGGAGYIGAHVVRLLGERGDEVVVLDDLSTGDKKRIGDADLVVGSVLDQDALRAALDGAGGVIHFAARKQVGESVERPLYYWHENVGGMRMLLSAMVDAGVERIVYSSSAAVYGIPHTDVVTEDTTPQPINPYGETKLVGEWMLAGAARAHGIRYAALRYFNVAGADEAGELGDPAALNLIPMVFEAIRHGRRPQVFGDDYPTPDGTCVRDYVHVVDLAGAHLAAADTLDGSAAGEIFNIGVGRGFSVLDVIRTVAEVTGRTLEPEHVPRRPGDPPALVASVDKVARALGWRAERTSLDDIVGTAWRAYARRHNLEL